MAGPFGDLLFLFGIEVVDPNLPIAGCSCTIGKLGAVGRPGGGRIFSVRFGDQGGLDIL